MVRDQWFGSGPGRVKKGDGTKIKLLVVLDPRLFSVRDKNGRPTKEWSLDTLRQAAAKWDKIVIFERRSFRKDVDEQQLLQAALVSGEAGEFKNVEVLLCGESVVLATDELKKRVLDVGARIKPVKNPREVTYLNMDKFLTDGDNITWVRSWDQIAQLGIEPEKPKTFDDLKKDRGKQSFWGSKAK